MAGKQWALFSYHNDILCAHSVDNFPTVIYELQDIFCGKRKQKTQYSLRLLLSLYRLSLQIKPSSALDNACLCTVSVFFRQKYNHNPRDIIIPSIRVYFQMSGTRPEECDTTSRRVVDETKSVGPAIRAILRWLIKTSRCCRHLDSNRMFSGRCQWRLQQENCWINHSSFQIMKNFLFCFEEGCRSFLLLHVFLALCSRCLGFVICFVRPSATLSTRPPSP